MLLRVVVMWGMFHGTSWSALPPRSTLRPRVGAEVGVPAAGAAGEGADVKELRPYVCGGVYSQMAVRPVPWVWPSAGRMEGRGSEVT